MISEKTETITVVIYTHPELYPPVLNAVDELSDMFKNVRIVCRNLVKNEWGYPANVQFVSSGASISIRESETASTGWKIKSFLQFTRHLYRSLRNQNSCWVMCNDSIGLFSFRLIRPFLGYKTKLWYHSHDVVELKALRRYSIGDFAMKSEKSYFNKIDLFTLPSFDRFKYYPVQRLKGKQMLVPNFPSLRRMKQDRLPDWKAGTTLKLLYQGRLSNEHGLEEIMDLIKVDSSLSLTIIGPGDPGYIQFLKDKIVENGIAKNVEIRDAVSYVGLKDITREHHVGLAINKPVNILYETAVMASNKIYEYVAAGLPILYYKNEHNTKFLGRYSWAFSTTLDIAELSHIMGAIVENYKVLSLATQEDFQNKLNFGIVFKPVKEFILQEILSNKQ